MNRYFHLIALVFLWCSVAGQQGKCPAIPETTERKTKEDYKRDEPEVKALLKWLCKTPYGADVARRADANYYVLQWLSGHPDFTLNVHSDVLPPGSDTTDLIYSLIHGMLLYKLEHPKEVATEKLHAEGLRVVAFLSEQSESYAERKELRPLFRAYRKKQLAEYAIEQMNRNSKPKQ